MKTLQKLLIIGFSVLTMLNTSLVWSQSFQPAWQTSIAGKQWDIAMASATDSEGNFLLAGSFSDTLNYQGQLLVPVGEEDIFIAKFSPEGELLWVKQEGGKAFDVVTDLYCDAENNIYTCGNFQDTAYFSDNELITDKFSASFLSKYDPSGMLQWIKNIDIDCSGEKTYICADSLSGYYWAGTFRDSLETSDLNLYSEGATDVFVIEFSPEDGHWIASETLGGESTDRLNSIITQDSRLLLAGVFHNSMNLGDSVITGRGRFDSFVAEYSSSLELNWYDSFGGTLNDVVRSIATDTLGGFALGGDFEFFTIIGEDTLISVGWQDMFVVYYDSLKEQQFVEAYGSKGNDRLFEVIGNIDNNFYLFGNYADTLQMKNHALVPEVWGNNLFIAKLTNASETPWVKRIGGTASSNTQSLHSDPAGNFYFISGYDTTSTFFVDSIVTGFHKDIYVSKFFDCGMGQVIELPADTTFCGSGTIAGVHSQNVVKFQ